MGVFDFNAAYAAAAKVEPPRPLMRELPPAEPFPVSALGPTLGRAACARVSGRISEPHHGVGVPYGSVA